MVNFHSILSSCCTTLLSQVDQSNRKVVFKEFVHSEWMSNLINTMKPITKPSTRLNNRVLEVFDDFSIFHSSVPNIKLYYPEPFIASPTFAHDDIWFLHIVTYQYWLWFFFIYLIIFFFMAFLITVRWCNVRHRPVRETRGVSRSKCGDLITATVPVSWAASIIIHESTDAIELSDGFGTTEMAVGIRAYQWGWEYYYPKDLDINLKRGESSMRLGHSLKYNTFSGEKSSFLSHKTSLFTSDYVDSTKTPLAVLLNGPSSTFNNLNFGVNKLLTRNATSLLTTPHILNINNVLKNPAFKSTLSSPVINFYMNYSCDDFIQSKPVYYNQQINALTTRSILSFTQSYSNLADIGHFFKTNNFKSFWLFNINPLESFILGHDSFVNKSFSSYYSLNIDRHLITHLTLNDQPLQKINSLCTSISLPKRLNSPLITKYSNHWLNFVEYSSSSWPNFSLIADQDFKRWASQELMEDLIWSMQLEKNSLNNRLSRGADSLPAFSENNTVAYFSDFTLPIYTDTFTSQDVVINFIGLYANYLSRYLTQLWSNQAIYSNYFIIKHGDLLRYLLSSSLFQYNLSIAPRSLSQFEFLTSYAVFSSPLKNIVDCYTLTSANSTNLSYYNLTLNLSSYFEKSAPDYLAIGKSMTMFNQAFWKVFKAIIDEERTAYNLYNLSRTNELLPLIHQPLPALLGLLQKNNVDLIASNVYQINMLASVDYDSIEKVWNNFTLNFPFNLSFESDIIRYSWFDWYSVRNTIITKAIDTSVFSLYGAKQYNYTFTKDPKVSLLNKTDNFFVKYTHARKLYIPSYIYTPYFYSKFRDWSLNSSFSTLLNNASNINFDNHKTLTDVSIQMLTTVFAKTQYHPFTANFSNTASPTRAFFTSLSGLNNKVDTIAILFDILTRRDYLIRYLATHYNTRFLINSSLYSPSFVNPIVMQLKTLINEFNSPFQKNSINSSLQQILSDKNTFYNNYTYLDFYKTTALLEADSFALKSQYQPMRKGIVNMIRIQADKAVAMPTDTRLQILAVSKDIIHSWSIPSAGIKIDCIPGYSSHRVALFTLSGIYWGQCMEICGRFHHWMPIVVYFIRRDLFCVWCVHFVFKNKQMNSILQSFDNSFYDSTPAVSLNFNTWHYEL